MSKLRPVLTFISTKTSLLEECHHLIYTSHSVLNNWLTKFPLFKKKEKNLATNKETSTEIHEWRAKMGT